MRVDNNPVSELATQRQKGKQGLPFREARCDIVIDVSQLDLEVVGLGENLFSALIGILPSCCQLGAGLQQWRKQVLDTHADLLLTPPLVPFRLHNSCSHILTRPSGNATKFLLFAFCIDDRDICLDRLAATVHSLPIILSIDSLKDDSKHF